MAVVQRNAEVVREAFERWAADDFTGVVALYAPDVTLDTGGVVTAQAIYRGREQVGARLADAAVRHPVRSFRRLELEENGDWVLAVSEFDDGLSSVVLFRLRDGLIARIEALPSAGAARRRLSRLAEGAGVEPVWAPIGAHEHINGQLELADGEATLCLDDRQIGTELPAALRGHLALREPVLAYLDDDARLLGWYLPEHQVGVDLRGGEGVA